MNAVTIRLHVEKLPEGVYLATSEDVPGLIAQGNTLKETLEIAQDLTRLIYECCIECGDPIPDALVGLSDDFSQIDLCIPVGIS